MTNGLWPLGLALLLLAACGDDDDPGPAGDGDADADADGDADGDWDADGDACEDECPAADGARCNGDVIETCTAAEDGCLRWADSEDCADQDTRCEDAGERPACTCDLCPAAGDTQCNGDVIERCTQDAEGCRQWVAVEDCSSSDLLCGRRDGGPVCVACDWGVWDLDYTISDAASLEALAGYTGIDGSLSIRSADLVSLDALGCLQEVGGELFIGRYRCGNKECHLLGNDVLANLDGLSRLTSVGFALNILGNPALTDLDGLGGLTSIGGGLYIHDDDALTSLEGLSGITSIAGSLSIHENDALTSMEGLDGITSIGGWLSIYDNDALTNLDGLRGLTDVRSFLSIVDNTLLPTCEATLLRDRLIGLPSTIEGNDDDGVCE